MSLTTPSQSSPDMRKIEELVKAFLNEYKYLYEVRLQKLMYTAELYTIANYDTRLTTVDFHPYMYGAYSHAIHDAIESVAVETDVVVRDGVKTQKYLSYGVDEATLTVETEAILNSVHKRTKSTPTTELIDDSKDTWLYNQHTAGELMNFEAYWEEKLKGTEKENRVYYDSNAPNITLSKPVCRVND